MNYPKSYFLILFLSCLQACVSSKGDIKHSGGEDEAIQNAIQDFSKITWFHKKDSVFTVRYYDTLYRAVLEKRDDGTSAWINGEPYEGITAVGISGANGYKFVLTSKATTGSTGILPSRFIENDGRLFYWWDDNYPFTETGLALLKKYHLIQEDSTRSLSISADDAKKGVHYYFCRSDLSIYKRKITNIGIGFYTPPTLLCDH